MCFVGNRKRKNFIGYLNHNSGGVDTSVDTSIDAVLGGVEKMSIEDFVIVSNPWEPWKDAVFWICAGLSILMTFFFVRSLYIIFGGGGTPPVVSGTATKSLSSSSQKPKHQ